MILTLTILVLLLDIGLRISIVGLDLAFFVGGRLDSLRSSAGTIAYIGVQHKLKNKAGKHALRATRLTGKAVGKVVKTGVNVAKAGVKAASKVVLKLFEKVASVLWKLLLSLSVVLAIVDLIVFLILTVVAYFYLYWLQAQPPA